MNSRIFLSAFCFLLLAATTPSVVSQEAGPTLDAVVVSGSSKPAPRRAPQPSPRPQAPAPPPAVAPEPASAPLVINDASLTVPTLDAVRENLSLTPGGVGVVDARTYKEGRATNLKDALDFAPGVFVQPRFGADESRVSIRGSGIQRTFHGRGIRLLQDGVPLSLADGGFDMQAVEPLAAQYVEVYRGGNALRYGSTTLGGAVNFVSPTGHDAAPLTLRFEAGSFDTIRGQISAAGVDGPFDYYTSFTHASTNGFRDHSRQSTQRFFSNFGYQFNDDVETRFYLTYVNTDSELPGSLTRQQLRDNPRQAQRNPGNPMFDNVLTDWRRDFELFRMANRTSFRIDSDQQLHVSTFYAYKDLDHPILHVIDQLSHDLGLDVNYVNTAERLGRENRLTLGFATHYGHTTDRRFNNVLGTRGAQFADNRQQSLNFDLYGENVHYLHDRFALVAGAQISHASRDNTHRFPVGNSSDHQNWWGFSPKLGVVYDISDETQLFANVSRSFEPASFGELTAPVLGGSGLVDLDAQTATTFEIGTRGRSGDGRLSWDAVYYYSWVRDELMTYELLPGLTQTVNGDRTIHQGIELGAEIALVEGLFTGGYGGAKSPVDSDVLVLRQNYLWSHFRFDGDAQFGNNHMPGIPEHYYRAELLYRHPGGFYAGPGIEWVFNDYYVDSANTLSADAYALLSFKVGYKTEKGLSFYIDMRNLTDEHYAATTGVIHRAGPFNGNQFLPGDGRSVFVGLEYQF